jgi:hypothetical protein
MTISVRNIIILFLILVFLSGFVVVSNNNIYKDNSSQTLKTSCPNILLRNGNKLSLLNTKTPDIKPIIFNSLEEYKKYHDKQEKNGTTCPILYVQEENDTQGKDVYKIYPNPFSVETGLLTMPLTQGIETMVTEKQIDDVMMLSQSGYTGYNTQELNIGLYQ